METAVELMSMTGMMLDALAEPIRKACELWIQDGKDIGEIALLVGVTARGGAVNSHTRTSLADLAVDTARAGMPAGEIFEISGRVAAGRRDRLPVVFAFLETRPIGFHLAWIEPVLAKEALS